MRSKIFKLAAIVLLTLSFSAAKAQYYCFWVANNSSETFNELKIRKTGSGNAFSRDLLPSEFMETGKHFWVKTYSCVLQLTVKLVMVTSVKFAWVKIYLEHQKPSTQQQRNPVP